MENSKLSHIFLDFSDSLVSRASHIAFNGVGLVESATLMHFNTHKQFQYHQITLSLPNVHFITFNDNNHLNDDRQ